MKISKLSFIVLAVLIADVRCLNFYLEPNARKCLRDEVRADVQVTGDYSVTEVLGQRVDYVIKDNNGHILSQKDDIPPAKNREFSFITETVTVFEICFMSKVLGQQPGQKQAVSLLLKRGIEAKNYEGIGEAAKLKPIEVELKKLEDLSEVIVRDFATMRENEKQLRDSNEVTNSRVLYFSIFSMCCLLGLATWQVFYLRRFFRAKKLIE